MAKDKLTRKDWARFHFVNERNLAPDEVDAAWKAHRALTWRRYALVAGVIALAVLVAVSAIPVFTQALIVAGAAGLAWLFWGRG